MPSPLSLPRSQMESKNGFTDLPLIHRERELSKLTRLSMEHKPALICGPPGIGKTRLLLEIRRKLVAEGSRVLYIPFVPSLHVFLAGMASSLSFRSTAASSVTLRGLLWKTLKDKPHIILLDDIDEPTLPFYRFFERILYMQGIVLIGAAVHSHMLGSLHRVFWNQQSTFLLPALPKQAATTLAETATRLFTPDLLETPVFLEQVVRNARGNPGRIVEMCRRAADPAYRDGERVRFAALSIDSLTRLVS